MATSLTVKKHDKRVEDMEKLISELPPKLAHVRKEIQDIQGRVEALGITAMWEIGKRVYDVHTREHEYGSGSFETLAASLGYSESFAYNLRSFYVDFQDKDDLNKLVSLRTKTSNSPISFNHIQKLLSVKEKDMREQLLDKIVEEDLSVDELAHEIKVTTGGSKRKPGAGRPVKVPGSAIGLFKNFIRVLGVFVRNDELMYRGGDSDFPTAVRDLAATKLKAEVIDLNDQCLDLLDRAEAIIPDLRKSLTTAKGVLQSRLEAEANKESSQDIKDIDEEEEEDDDFDAQEETELAATEE